MSDNPPLTKTISDKLQVTAAIRKTDFENKVHIAIIDRLIDKERLGELNDAHATAKDICKLVSDRFYTTYI